MYSPVIGLEIHIQVKTDSKMFCRCSTDYFNKEPNTYVCEVCFGLPGALPMTNKLAFEKCIKLALALNCSINQYTKFDRKNYFYPDLPKGYQISQYDYPVGYEGYVEIEIGDDARRIRIQRVHLEEDTAKSIHSEENNETLIDFNKSGMPLIEVVTKPDFANVEEVTTFAKRLRQIVRYTQASDAEMQKGQMRYELNISLRDETQQKEDKLPDYKIEVKNIGSISVLEKVIKFETERQSELLDKSEKIPTQTRGLKDMSGETIFQRSKETADDYRYFPEPDIPPISIEDSLIIQLKESIPELPLERKNRYLNLGLSLEQSDIFVEDQSRGDFFDNCIDISKAQNLSEEAKEIAKWINTDLAGLLIKKGSDFNSSLISAEDIIYIVTNIKEKKITPAIAKKVLEEAVNSGELVQDLVKKQGLDEVLDDSKLEEIILKVIENNIEVFNELASRPNSIKFLIGQVMKESKGKADPKKIEEIILSKSGN
jgi:aspartyl-tRNA(Asn)/glutamyl-tRNA(Gln) amidotransferase subunit B